MAIFTESGAPVAPVNLDGSPMNGAASDSTEGEREQEVADPASDPETDEGTEEQEVADPDGAEDTEPSEAVPEDGKQVESSKNPQSKTENRKFAAARRKQEIEDAQNQARDDLIAQLQLTNPATQKPYQNYAEFAESAKAEKQSKIREQLEAAGVDPALLDALIEENPAVAEAKRVVESARAAEAQAKKATDEANFQKLLKDVGSVIPEIKTQKDLFAWEYFDEFRLLVTGGKAPLHAAKVLAGGNREAAGRQAAMNAMASKSHLTSTSMPRGNSDYGITDKQYANMLALNPGMTRKEAAAAIRKYKK